jgi:hypothetical protein
VRVLVIRAEEDWAIAKECWKLAQANTPAVTTNASVAQKESLQRGERAASESGIN